MVNGDTSVSVTYIHLYSQGVRFKLARTPATLTEVILRFISIAVRECWVNALTQAMTVPSTVITFPST